MDVARSATALATPRRKPLPLAFWLHSILGFKLSLFLGFVCLTGTIATVSHEIEWLYKPQVRASAVVGEPEWGAMWDNAQAAFPDARLAGIGSFDRDDAAYFVKSISAEDRSGQTFDIYVDPGTNTITGHEIGRSFQDFMRALHYYLFAPTWIAMYATTALGFVLVASLVTGLVTYKKFWRGLWRWPRWRRGARAAIGDLHRLVGLWSVWFAFLIGITSIWYFVEHAGVDLNTPPPKVQAEAPGTPVSGEKVDRWVALARQRMPGLHVTAIALPYEAGDPAIVQGQWRAALVRERTNAIYIDPATDRVVGQRFAHKLGIGERIVHSADPLHFGTFGGLAVKFLWVVFGLMLTGMAATGAWLYAKRMRIAVDNVVSHRLFDYLGGWKWPSLALVFAVPPIAFLTW